MKRAFFPLCALLFTLQACHTVRVETPTVEQLPEKPRQTLQEKKDALKNKQKSASQVPEVLGGIVQSDQWTIYKEEQQEEFTGHVFYDNGIYTFKAGYALSDRKKGTVTARQDVYLKQHARKAPSYEAWADYAHYNYQTGKGVLKSTSKNPARLRLQDDTQTITARAKHISFDTNAQIFVLTGNVYAQRTVAEGTQTVQADKATFKQLENYLLLDGHASLKDDQRTLEADTIIYDGEHDHARAFGARPLATGTTQQGTFAIIADNVTSDAQGNVVTLDGQVQGWVVSPTLNENKVNRQF